MQVDTALPPKLELNPIASHSQDPIMAVLATGMDFERSEDCFFITDAAIGTRCLQTLGRADKSRVCNLLRDIRATVGTGNMEMAKHLAEQLAPLLLCRSKHRHMCNPQEQINNRLGQALEGDFQVREHNLQLPSLTQRAVDVRPRHQAQDVAMPGLQDWAGYIRTAMNFARAVNDLAARLGWLTRTRN